MLTEIEPFVTWKDPRAYNAVVGCCQSCHAVGRTVKLPSRAKALNHWSSNGSGKDPAATIKDCLTVRSVPGLMEWARSGNVRKKDNRHHKHDLDHRQQELNSVTDSRPTTSRLLTSTGVSSAHGSVGSDEKKPDRKVKFNT